ncbi:MAG: phospholipid carrier-dependent glycosyltransferase [Actinomycetota bacterium]|nr:phospholipid carrier-dependent glycosyltransferase [Actinomycetota bacterium]
MARRTEESASRKGGVKDNTASLAGTPEDSRRATGPPEAPSTGWRALDWLWLSLITLAGGIVRLFRVADPREFVFDEVYYAKDACMYVHASIEKCKLDELQNEVHPPLGKWLIAGGIKVFGFNSLGYRIAVVIAGTVTIALLFLLARVVLRSTLGASIAAGLLAIDPLHFVQSRTSMLDVFVPMFGVAAFLFVALDRRRLLLSLRRGGRDTPRAGVLGRPWRLAAGIAAGAALASKWSGAFVVLAVISLTLAWELRARREEGWGQAFRRVLREEVATIFLWLAIVPVAVYIATYIGRGIEGDVLALPWAEGSWWRALWDKQAADWHFHTVALKDASHPYQSPPWSWILLKRPVSYFYEGADAEGNVREILATGSPFVWWASILAVVFTAWQWVRRRKLGRPEGIVLAGVAFTYGPWLLPVDRPTVFLFYFVSVVPFLCLALGYVAVRIGRSWEARSAITAFAVIALGFFAFYYPLLTKGAISQSEWTERILFFDDCDKPPGKDTTTTVTETVNGRTTTSPSVSNSNEDVPPPGWCWI